MPNGWHKSTLGKHVKIYSGNSPSQVPLAVAGAFPFVKVDDLNNCSKYQSTGRAFTNDQKFCAPAGSVIFPKRGAAILNNKIRIASVELAMDTNLMAVSPANGLDGEFLFYLIQKEGLFKIADTSTIPQLNNKHIIPYEFDLPPIDEQRKIAAILRTWDDALEKLSDLHAALLRRDDWLQWRLINSEKARHNWSKANLGCMLRERSERSTVHDEHPVLTSSRRGMFLQTDYFSRQVTSEDNSGYKIMRSGDFTFRSMSDDGRFFFNRLSDQAVGIISPAYSVFYATSVSAEFLKYLLNSEYFASILSSEVQGGTRKALRFSALAGMEVHLPAPAEQQRITAILNTSRAAFTMIDAQIKVLSEQKRGLMQRLLTGQWRVKVGEKEDA